MYTLAYKMDNLKTAKWKPVQLQGIVSENDLEGLIGIEELTDYNLDDIVHDKKQKRKIPYEETDRKPKKVKRKLKQTEKDDRKIAVSQNFTSDSEEENSQAGAFVRSPKMQKLIAKKEAMKKEIVKMKKKSKVEIGHIVNENRENKLAIDDLKSWRIVPLQEPIVQALADLGFEKPTPIQELTLPAAILGRRDILGAAETGSGKTLAFGLPIISGILNLKNQNLNTDNDVDKKEESENEELEEDENNLGLVKSITDEEFFKNDEDLQYSCKPLYCLVLTPTRELAVQVKNHLNNIAKYVGIKVAVVVGGMAAVKQERILQKGPEIVVATPGRLWELIQQGNSHLSQIDSIKYLAIDETDRMLETGHFQELHNLLERLNANEIKMKSRQNFVFSATLTLVHDLPKHVLKKRKFNKNVLMTPEQKLAKIINMLGITDPKIVDVTQATGTASTLMECRINCEIQEKDYYIFYFLQQYPGRTLIFCNSVGCVKRLGTILTLLGCSALPLHAMMQQRQRLKNLEKFRDDPDSVLIATDVAARGLDIPNIEHVVHYQTPRTGESYVHRSGRTARAKEQGITVLMIEPNEVRNYIKLCKTLGRSEDLPQFPITESILNAVKQRVNLARDVDKLELQLKKSSSEAGWLQKVAREMDIIGDDDDDDDDRFKIRDEDKANTARLKQQIKIKRKQLNDLLAKPLFPRGFTVKYPTSSGQPSIPLVQGEETKLKAIDVMKNELENCVKERTRRKKLFKEKPKPKSKAIDVKKVIGLKNNVKNKKRNGRNK